MTDESWPSCPVCGGWSTAADPCAFHFQAAPRREPLMWLAESRGMDLKDVKALAAADQLAGVISLPVFTPACEWCGQVIGLGERLEHDGRSVHRRVCFHAWGQVRQAVRSAWESA